MSWQPIHSAPKDGTPFVGYDTKQGRCVVRQEMRGGTLHTETWAIDPSGLIDPPDPHLWAPLPAPPGADPGIPIYASRDATDDVLGKG